MTSLQTDCLVVGSGPGSCTAAVHLAEAGQEVLMVEEARRQMPDPPLFSHQEILSRYRHAGLSAGLGTPSISYAEGFCPGGGSEVNSGLYHRLPNAVCEEWESGFRLEDFTPASLEKHFEWVEREVGIHPLPGNASRPSLKLEEGAKRMNWECQEVPRFYRYEKTEAGWKATRQSMTRTLLPRFQERGGVFREGVRVLGMKRSGDSWQVSCQGDNGKEWVQAKHVFLGAGAVHTAFLLRQSGLGKNVGRSLHFHPMLKVVARFPEPINEVGLGVGVHQVKEFSPAISLGCSVSSLPFLAVGLLEHQEELGRLRSNWPRLANYYVQVAGQTKGKVGSLPWSPHPLVRYRILNEDISQLQRGWKLLSDLLFAAGAECLFPAIRDYGSVEDPIQAARNFDIPDGKKMQLVSVHVMGSCPMGADSRSSAASSFGEIHGEKSLTLVDSSGFCGSLGVNPQGTIMALSRRNVLHFLEKI